MTMPEPAAPYLDSTVSNGVLVVTVRRTSIEGEAAAKALGTEIEAALAQTPATRVVVDLQHVRYITSVAFWPLLALRRRLRQQGGRLLVCGLTEGIRDIFLVTRMVSTDGSLNTPFEMAEDRDTALALLHENKI